MIALSGILLTAQLAAPTATLPEEFTRIVAAWELSDGRVIIADGAEKRIIVADLGSGAIKVIGRTGRGPQEFLEPSRIHPIGNDSALMQDGGSARKWLVFVRDSIAGSLAPDHPAIQASAGSLHGAALNGIVLARRSDARRDLRTGFGTLRSHVVRVDRTTGRSDTIAQVSGVTIETRETRPPPNQGFASFVVIFSVADQSVMFADGWVAVAYSDPYRVDWYPPAAARVGGPLIPFAQAEVTQAEKQYWHDRLLDESGSDRAFDFSNVPFAKTIPPFRDQGLFAMPDGRLLVLRERSVRAPGNDYDIIDRRGMRAGSLALPPTERIIGFGRGSVYVVVRDEDGIERLRRHPWPAR